jgi:hypothetical protein
VASLVSPLQSYSALVATIFTMMMMMMMVVMMPMITITMMMMMIKVRLGPFQSHLENT